MDTPEFLIHAVKIKVEIYARVSTQEQQTLPLQIKIFANLPTVENGKLKLKLPNFIMECRIESEELDSGRDRLVCEYLEGITFTKKPDGIIKLLHYHPNTSVAAALKMPGINYWSLRHSDLKPVSDTNWHAFLCRDFSVMICARNFCWAHDNIFDFIDGTEQLNYPPDNPVRELVRRVRASFGFEQVARWATK